MLHRRCRKQAVRKTRPHLTKRCYPFLLHRSAIMILRCCSRRRLEELCVFTIWTLMNHQMTWDVADIAAMEEALDKLLWHEDVEGVPPGSVPEKMHVTTRWDVSGIGRMLTSAGKAKSDPCAESTSGKSGVQTCAALDRSQPQKG